jgi:hypothetical protein
MAFQGQKAASGPPLSAFIADQAGLRNQPTRCAGSVNFQ